MTTISTRKILKTVSPVEDDEISLTELESQAPVTDTDQDNDVPDDLAFQSIINELGLSDESGKVNVYKLQKGNYHDQIFLFECLPSEFNLTMLQNPEYHDDGFHKFKVILRNSKNIVKAKQIAVMPNAKLFEIADSASVTGQNNSEVIAMLKAMNDNTQALIMSLSRNQPAEKAKTTMEFLTEMQMMKEIFGANAPAPQQSPLEVLELAKELAQAINPDADTGIMSTMGRMLEKYGEPLMAAIASQPAPVPVRMPNPASALPASPHGVTPNPIQPVLPVIKPLEKSDDMNFMLKMYLGQLIGNAERGAEVGLYADVILDQVGDAIYPMIESPDWFSKLVAVDPRVEAHKQWFYDLKEAILIDPDEASAQDIESLTSDEISSINEVKSILSINTDELSNADDLIA